MNRWCIFPYVEMVGGGKLTRPVVVLIGILMYPVACFALGVW